MIRNDWTLEEAQAIHALPFPDLMHRAQSVHRQHFDPHVVEQASLLSIKTGADNHYWPSAGAGLHTEPC